MKIDAPASTFKNLATGPTGSAEKADDSKANGEFSQLLEQGMEKLNGTINKADDMAQRLAAGEDVDVPDAMIAITKADISFKMFLQLRNKALSAYEEIMRLQF